MEQRGFVYAGVRRDGSAVLDPADLSLVEHRDCGDGVWSGESGDLDHVRSGAGADADV